MQLLTQLCVKKKLLRHHTRTLVPAAFAFFMSLLLSFQPVLCMVSETKEAVDHTSWEHFLFSCNNSGSWVFNKTVRVQKWWWQTSPKFVKIRKFWEGIPVNSVQLLFIVYEIWSNETDWHCENRLGRTKIGSKRIINDRKDEGNKASNSRS